MAKIPVHKPLSAHAEHVVDNMMTSMQIDFPRDHGIYDIAVKNVERGIRAWMLGHWPPHGKKD